MAAVARAMMLLGTLLVGTLATSTASQVTPIQKVIELMNDMLAKADAEKKDEEVKFTAFQQWCGDQTKVKNNEIAASNDKIDELTATIEKAAALIRRLTDRIEELEEDNSRWEADKKAAAAVREKENVDFRATQTDYAESLSALEQAINVLKKQSYDRPQAELLQSAFVQLQSKRIVPAAAKSALTAFLQQGQPSTYVEEMPDERMSYDAPEANAYEFQSSGIVDMLVKLEDEFKDKKRELEQEEMDAQHSFELIFQTLTDNIENASHEIEKKTKLRAETMQAKADAESDKAQTIIDRDEDARYLQEMTALCQQKANDFASRQELRAGEIEAINKAIEIISSASVSGSGEKHLPALLQIRSARGSALVQVDNEVQNPMQNRIAAFLAERSRLTGSKLLSRVSQEVAANPFGKVKKMIKDLIVKLMEEATAEVEHKGWCDTELGTNKQTRDRKTEQVNQLTADIEEMNAKIAQLTQDIEDLTAAVAELNAAMAKATEERLASKEKNEQTIKDAQEAQTAVDQAMAVLKEFYAKSAQATALTQQSPADDAPETFDKPYQGQLSEGGGVVDFLEVILSDFARLESQTTGDEATESEEFKNYMFESTKDKALKENEIKHKNAKKTDTETALHQAEEELKNTQDQLDKAVEYYEKLKPECVDSGITYEDRVKRRESEIQSLKEALAILSGVDFA